MESRILWRVPEPGHGAAALRRGSAAALDVRATATMTFMTGRAGSQVGGRWKGNNRARGVRRSLAAEVTRKPCSVPIN